MANISTNLCVVKNKIDAAARKSGRTGEDVTLVVVTKTRSVEEIREAIAAGAVDIGENYVQEAEDKFAEIGEEEVKWHLIGHLQRNKVRHAVEVFSVIHSIDSEELAREIGKRSEAIGKLMDVLVEVKVSGEATKFGVDPKDTLSLVDKISSISGIRVCGLMGMAPAVASPEEARPYFSEIKKLWAKLPEEQRLYLSMGMTSDYEVAVEEGSNMVRIGTAIFGPRG